MIKGNDNLITALIGGAIILIRNNAEAFLFVGADSRKISVYNARNLVAYNIIKVAGAEHPHDIYYISTFDDFVKKTNESQYFKSDMEDSLDIESFKDELPQNMRRNDIEYFKLFARWKEGDDEEAIIYRKKILALLNWKQKD